MICPKCKCDSLVCEQKGHVYRAFCSCGFEEGGTFYPAHELPQLPHRPLFEKILISGKQTKAVEIASVLQKVIPELRDQSLGLLVKKLKSHEGIEVVSRYWFVDETKNRLQKLGCSVHSWPIEESG